MESTILEFPFFFWAMLVAIAIIAVNMIGLAYRVVKCTRRFGHIPGVTGRARPIVLAFAVAIVFMGAGAVGMFGFREHLHERNQSVCQKMLVRELDDLRATTRRASKRPTPGGDRSRANLASGTILCLMTDQHGELDVEWSRGVSDALSLGEQSHRFAKFPEAEECECKYRLWRAHPEELLQTGCRYFAVITPDEIGTQAYSTKVYIEKIPGTIFQKRESMSADGGNVVVRRYSYQGTLLDAASGVTVAAESFKDRPFPKVLYNLKGPGGGVPEILAWAVDIVPDRSTGSPRSGQGD